MHMKIMLAAAAVALTPSAAWADSQIQGFETRPTGSTEVYFEYPDTGYGYFLGGTVAEPGLTVGSEYLLAGSKVLYGTDIYFSTLYFGYYHCCGYGRHEMLIAAPQGVQIDIYGHGPGWEDDWNEVLLHSEILTGLNISFGWGVPLEDQTEPGFWVGDITSIRWTGVNGAAFAIDNFRGRGLGAVPEPASWAMMIAGFGLVGAAVRRRKAVLA